MNRTKLLLVAAVLIVAGVMLFALKPSGPEAVCVSDNTPSSGFIDEEKDCPISIESYNEIREFKSGPQWFNIGGLVFVLAGVGVGVYALVKSRRVT